MIANQSYTQKFPIIAYLSFWSLNWPCNQVSILSRVCNCGFQSHHHLALTLTQSQEYTSSLQKVVQGNIHSGGTSHLLPPVSECCCQGEGILDLCVLLHWVVVSQRLEPGEAQILVWEPALGSWLPTLWGLSPRWAWHECSHSCTVKQEPKKPRKPEPPSQESELLSSFCLEVLFHYSIPSRSCGSV